MPWISLPTLMMAAYYSTPQKTPSTARASQRRSPASLSPPSPSIALIACSVAAHCDDDDVARAKRRSVVSVARLAHSLGAPSRPASSTRPVRNRNALNALGGEQDRSTNANADKMRSHIGCHRQSGSPSSPATSGSISSSLTSRMSRSECRSATAS